MALATGKGTLEEKFSADLELNSPSVGILSQRFPGPGKYHVLDFGAPAESNVAFFADGSCRIYVEDLYRYLIAPRQKIKSDGDDGEDAAAAVSAALGYEHSARFDLVLGWDLFSYMDRSTIELVMAHVARACRSGTLLFLTLSTDTEIPSVPAQICMTESGRLRYRRPGDGRTISNPRFPPTVLESMMPGFRLLHSFLLAEKMQEFLFSFA